MIKTALKVKLQLLAGLIILAAVVVLSLRLSLWLLPVYQEELKSWLSSEDYQIDFERLDVDWQQGLPQLDADGLSLTATQSSSKISAKGIEARIDWWRTLQVQKLVFSQLKIEGLEAKLDLASPEIQALFNNPKTGKIDTPLWLADLALQRRVELVDGQVLILDQQRNIYDLSLSGELIGELDGFNSVIRLQNPDQQTVEARINLTLQQQLSSGRFYIDISEQAFSYWQPLIYDYVPALSTIQAGGKLWLDWNNNVLTQASADIQLNELEVQLEDKSLDIDDLYFRLRGGVHYPDESEQPQWRFLFEPSQGSINGAPIPFDVIRAEWLDNRITANIETLDLGILSRLLYSTPQIPEAVTKELAVLSPTGLLHDIKASVDLDSIMQSEPAEQTVSTEQSLPPFLLNATVTGVSVDPYQGAPRIDNIEGVLSHDQYGGVITFKSQPMFLDFPELFSNGWGLDTAAGTVLWKLSPGKVWVESDLLAVDMDGISAKGRFSLDMPYAKGTESHLSLLIGTQGADGTLTPALVPKHQVNPELYDWLSTAINKGQVDDGMFVYQGPLESWAPYPSIQAYFKVSGADLKYSPDWPAVTNVSGDVLLKGGAVLVQSEQGAVYNSSISFADVYLQDGSDFLAVDAALTGPAQDIRKTLLNSPVKERLGDEFRRWDLAGDTNTSLDLKLDLRDLDASIYQVSSTLKNGRFSSESRDLSIDEINGTLVYDHAKGLNARGLKARFFDRPILARIDTSTAKGATHTVVRADGSLDVGRFNQWLDLELLNLTKGVAQYTAFVDVCSSKQGDCSSIRVKSDLKGIETTLLPEPFAKTKNQPRPFELRTEIGKAKNWMRVKLPGQLNSLLLVNDTQLIAGDVVVGNPKQQPERREKGLWLHGNIDYVDIAEWQALFDRYSQDSITEQGTVNTHPLLQGIDLSVNQLKVSDDIAFDQLQLALKPDIDGQLFSVSSKDLEGTVFLPTKAGLSYRADFNKIYLPKVEKEPVTADISDQVQPAETVKQPHVDPLADMDPKQIPGLLLNIDDLRRGPRLMGQWEVNLEPKQDGIKLTALSGENKAFKLLGSAEWIQQQGSHLTRLNMDFSADQLADVQTLFDIDPVLESEKVKISADLFWLGSPLGYNTESLAGDVDLDAGKGRFLNAGSASALRLFGILNLNTIGRRLRLDFDDISQKGLSFDKILGHYRLTEGVAKSTEPLKFTGPSADIELTGMLNLTDETLDQNMRVTLPLSDNLPLTALLLGTPQVAGAVFLFDKLTGSKLSEITTTVYSVKGPWDEPKIEPIRSSKAKAKSN